MFGAITTDPAIITQKIVCKTESRVERHYFRRHYNKMINVLCEIEEEECDRCGRANVLECHSSKCIDHDEEEQDEEEWTEFEVEYGYMIDEETHGESYSEGYDDEKDAKEYYDMLVSNEEYDYVWLVMRHMEGEDCMCSETIEEWKQE